MNDGKGVIIMQNQNPNRYQTNRPHMSVLTNKLIMVKEKFVDKFNYTYHHSYTCRDYLL